MTSKILCLVSGGIDSFIMVDFLKQNQYQPICFFVDYGQLSAIYEFESFIRICEFEKIKKYEKIEIKNLGNQINSGLTNDLNPDDFFPSRNLILIALISPFLNQMNINNIAIGIINSLRSFPDCKRAFLDQLEEIISLSVNKPIKILTPLIEFTKANIIEYAAKYDIPLEISYSCQKGIRNHCRKCPSCIERFEMLEVANNFNDITPR
ncbi:MAG: 7-cyano-7-deazaguanine synthase [Candidatus Helarchaeota archaeon]